MISDRWRMFLYMVKLQDVINIRERTLNILNEIPVSNIEFSQ